MIGKFNKRTIKDAGYVILDVRKSLKNVMKHYSTVPQLFAKDPDKGGDSSWNGSLNCGGKEGARRNKGWKSVTLAWKMKLKGPNRYQNRKKKTATIKVKSKDGGMVAEEGDDLLFTDLNVIQSTDSDEEDDLEFQTPDPDKDSDLKVSRPFTPCDDDSLDGASTTRERRLIWYNVDKLE